MMLYLSVLSRFETAAESEHRFLRELLHFIYLEYPDCRRLIRALIGRFLVGFTKVWEKSMAVSPILEVSRPFTTACHIVGSVSVISFH
jgi:hypothetical protein